MMPTTTIASVPVSAIVANTSSCSVMSSAFPSQVISLNWFDKESSTGRHLVRNISLQFSLDNTTSNTLYGISMVTAMYEILVNEVGKDKEDNNSTVGRSKFVKMTTGRLNTLEYPSTLHRSVLGINTSKIDLYLQVFSLSATKVTSGDIRAAISWYSITSSITSINY